MSKIQVNEIVNHFDTGAPDCPKGLTVTGFTTFTGGSSFSGDVSIGGTLTYEDVTNIDSVGIITAQSGVHYGTVGSGVTISAVGTGTNLGFLVNGSERVRINVSGKIGIGTTGSSDPNDGITLQQNDNIRWLSSAGNLRQAIRCTSSDAIDFYTGTNELAARVNSLKNLNLGGGSAFAAGATSGDFSIDISGLRQVVGSTWRQSCLLVFYAGIDGDGTDSKHTLTAFRIRGLSTYDNLLTSDILGTQSVTISNDTQTGCRLSFNVSNTNNGSVVAILTGGSGTNLYPTLTINI